jgi:hypothetical protein
MSKQEHLDELDRTAKMSAALMDEAATVLESLAQAVPKEQLEAAPNWRGPLLDELGGAAGLLRDSVDELRQFVVSRAQPASSDAKMWQVLLEAWQTSSYGQPSHQKAMVLAMTNLHATLTKPVRQDAAEPLKGWKLNHVQFERGSGKAQIGYLDPEDDRFAPILTVDTGQYYQPNQAHPLAVEILSMLAGHSAKSRARSAQEPAARECVDPMCACRGGPDAACSEGEREKELSDLRSSLEFHERRAAALQKAQQHMRDPERVMVCDILANGALLTPAGERYIAPPQHPAGPGQNPVELVPVKESGLDRFLALAEAAGVTHITPEFVDRLAARCAQIENAAHEPTAPDLATDAELSAALGWPGGISSPILDRQALLRRVAEMATQLRASEAEDSNTSSATPYDRQRAAG